MDTSLFFIPKFKEFQLDDTVTVYVLENYYIDTTITKLNINLDKAEWVNISFLKKTDNKVELLAIPEITEIKKE